MKLPLTLLILCLASMTFGQSVVHEVGIAQSNDDVEQEGDFVSLNDLELDLGWNQGEESKIGLIFRNANIDPGASIDSAYLRLMLQSALSDSLTVSIHLESEPFPLKYADTIGIDEGRSYVSTIVEWTLAPATAGTVVKSPDLSTLIQEGIALQNWGPSSGLNFLLTPNTIDDSVYLEAEFFSFDQNDPTRRPRLFIELDGSFINDIAASAPSSANVVVFPNPSAGLVTINASSDIKSLTLRDTQGRVVYFRQGLHSVQENLTVEAPGIYFLEAVSENGREVKRLIVR